MWDDIREEIEVEFELLNHLLETQRPLLVKCSQIVPSSTEITALASVLHSFYTGIEHIFKRVAKEIDQTPPVGDAWHRGLLRAMTQPNSIRPALISKEMEDQLLEYLKFRHFFRNAYTFELKWKKMSPLITELEQTLRRFENEIALFQEKLRNKGE